MPIQNQIYEVVNRVDYKELSKKRMQKMEEFLNVSKTRDIFLASEGGQPGHSHQKLKVRKLRDPLKRLIDKRSEEMAILANVEKKHQRRVQQVAAGIDPDSKNRTRMRKHRVPKTTQSASSRAASAGSGGGGGGGGGRRDATSRIGVMQWDPRKYEGTPEGHFARVMLQTRKNGGPQRRSFAHDPYVHTS